MSCITTKPLETNGKNPVKTRPFPFIKILSGISILAVFTVGTIFITQRSLQITRLNQGREMIVSGTSGSPTVFIHQKNFNLQGTGTVVRKDSTLKTGLNGTLDLDLPGRAFIHLDSETFVTFSSRVIQKKNLEITLNLQAGTVLIRALPLKPGDRFIVKTPGASASIVGTKYLVSLNRNGDTRVAVSEGKVQFKPELDLLSRFREDARFDPDALSFLSEETLPKVLVRAGNKGVISSAGLMKLYSMPIPLVIACDQLLMSSRSPSGTSPGRSSTSAASSACVT